MIRLHPSAVLVLAFAATIVLGTALLMQPFAHAGGQGAPLLTALFTATSAVCVTGLAVVDTGSYWSQTGQAIIMALFQIGGFGMMTSAALLLMLFGSRLSMGARKVLQSETHALAFSDVKAIAKMVLLVTLITELVIALALTLRWALGYGKPWLESLWLGSFHAVSAFNNAGFSPMSDNLMGYASDAFILLPIMAAITIGGLGFPVLYELFLRKNSHGRRRLTWSLHTSMTVWAYIGLNTIALLLLLWAEWDNPGTLGAQSWPVKVLSSAFAAVSARTAGFNSINLDALTHESFALHYGLMFVGAGSAGTGGGVKVTTFLVLLLVVWTEIRGRQDVEFRKRRIAPVVQRQALAVVFLSCAVIALAMLAILPFTVGIPYEKVMFEVLSAFATVGLSTGITPKLPPQAQCILIALMFIGRVGIVTLAMAMAIQGRSRHYRYPEEKAIVG